MKTRKKPKVPPGGFAITTKRETAETKFLRVLEGWSSVVILHTMKSVHIDREYILSPKRRVYRRAFNWEKPSLYIDADILPVEHAIRLTRITDRALCRVARKALRMQKRLQKGKRS